MAKTASILYGVSCLILLNEYGDPGAVLPTASLITCGIAAVWFPSELGGWLGPGGLRLLRTQRPALWLQRFGWGLLALGTATGIALS